MGFIVVRFGTLMKIYKAIVKPTSEFCNMVYSPGFKKEDDLEKVQQRATRMFKEFVHPHIQNAKNITSSNFDLSPTKSRLIRLTASGAFVANPDCMVANLLAYIKRMCNESDKKDLADEDGMLMNLGDVHPKRRASGILSTKTMYIPIKLERYEDGSLKPYTPLVPDMEKENQEFMRRLAVQYERRTGKSIRGYGRLQSLPEDAQVGKASNASPGKRCSSTNKGMKGGGRGKFR